MLYMKLRANIRMMDDVELARRELSMMFKEVLPVSSPNYFSKIGIPAFNTRPAGPVGFICKFAKNSFVDILRSVNFIQEIWVEKDDPIIKNYEHMDHSYLNGKFYMFVPVMAYSELIEKTYNGKKLTDKGYTNIRNYLAGEVVSTPKLYHKAINLQSSSTQHVHGLHKYKAKFFPRFVRSLIVAHIGEAPLNFLGEKTILDPFVGSGTALVESSILGFRSYGLDIDKLSCEITKAKISILKLKEEEAFLFINDIKRILQSGIPEYSSKKMSIYRFPEVISYKFKRWKAQDEQIKYEKQISSLLYFLDSIEDDKLQKIVAICLSDALCKKFNIRMMGTGSGRFALEIAKTELYTLFLKNLNNLMKMLFTTATLKKKFNIRPACAEVCNGNAKNMPYFDNQMSLVVTSPPYLPASSGRENYLVGKAISMTALGLADEKELMAIDQNSVGTIHAKIMLDDGRLPKAVYHLVDWLQNDPLRNVKAIPVLNYYLDLRKSLFETRRVLMNGGIAIYIIGKTSTFYNAKTRNIVYQVECDKIFSELARDVGFEIIAKTDIELDKKNKNARPRSLDSYFESAFVMKNKKQ